VHLGERECSVQRNHQKLVEESPSTVVDEALREEMGQRVCEGVRRIGYVGAGTMEFLRSPEGRLYFMEVNTRLQVEHPVTEMVTGLDLVQEQIRVAANQTLSIQQEEVSFSGAAIECRINAEDPYDGFRPSPGVVETFQPPAEVPGGATVRVDTHVKPGYRIPPYYDSMICKLIVHGSDREATRLGMLGALERFELKGIKSTIPAHLEILGHQSFVEGSYDTGLVARLIDAKASKASSQTG
jgi:acetyl-CoA carboxylase biotin carboxylase subunit